MSSTNKKIRSAGAKKLGSKACKTRSQKKSTTKIAEISKLAK